VQPGKMNIVWAYRDTDVPNDGMFAVHSMRGGMDYTFIEDTNGGGDGHHERGGMEYTFIDGKYTIVEINDKYRLYWAYDNATEMFYFTVLVQTTGWIAFGVSTQRGGMRGYDVMVGGVDSSGNGYILVRKSIEARRP